MASTYITKTPSSTTNQKTWTVSCWVKRSKISSTQMIWGVNGDSSGNYFTELNFASGDELEFRQGGTVGDPYQTQMLTLAKYRDVNAWYHIVVACDTTQSTEANRVKIYVNGEQITTWGVANYPSLNEDFRWHYTGYAHSIGRSGQDNARYFDGYISHFHNIDGTQYAASDFGSTDSTTGEWKINTSPSVTYGSFGTFLLKDGNSVTDQSGQGNNWTVGGGTLTKSEDCPSNVFATCTKEPIRTLSGTQLQPVLSNGNTTFDATGVSAGASVTLSSLGAKTGKYYMEAKVGGSYAGHSRIGVGTFEGYNGTTFFNATSSNYAAYTANGEKNIAGSTSSYGASYSAGDIISVALDCDNNTVTFYKNGTSQGAINITNDDNYKHFSIGGYDATGSNITNWQCNFGNGYFGTTAVSSAGTNASGIGIFEYDVPANHTALSTKGLNL